MIFFTTGDDDTLKIESIDQFGQMEAPVVHIGPDITLAWFKECLSITPYNVVQ